MCKSADEPIVNNNYLPCIEESSSVAAVKSQPAAVSMNDICLPIPVTDARVISPAAELSSECCDSGMSDAEQCSDTVNMSIPVLTSSHMSPRKQCNCFSATKRPLLTPVDDSSHTISTVIGQSGRKPKVAKCASKHRSLSHLVKSASDLDRASDTVVPCTDCDISTMLSGTLSDSLTVLAPEPEAAQETACLLPPRSVSVSTRDFALSWPGVSSCLGKEILREPFVGMLKLSESMTAGHSDKIKIHGAVSSTVAVHSNEMSIHGALLSPEMNINGAVSSPVVVHNSNMNIHGTVSSPEMNIHGALSSPVAVHNSGMNIHGAVSSPQMNIHGALSSPVAMHSSDMNSHGGVLSPDMNIHVAESSPQMNIYGAVSAPVAVPLISFAQPCASDFRAAGVMTSTESSVSWPVAEGTGEDLISALSAPSVSVLSGVMTPALSDDENMDSMLTLTSCCPGLITSTRGCISTQASSRVTCVNAVSSWPQVTHTAVTSMTNVSLHSSTAAKTIVWDMFRVDSPASFSTLASDTLPCVSAVACVAGVIAPFDATTTVASSQLDKYKLYSGLSSESVDSKVNTMCMSYSCSGTLSFPSPTTVRPLSFIPRVLSVKQNSACSAECAVEPSLSATSGNLLHSPMSCQAVSIVSVEKSSVSSLHITAVCCPESSVPHTNSDSVSGGLPESIVTAVKSAVSSSSTCATYSQAGLDADEGKSSILNVQTAVCVSALSHVSDSGISEVNTVPLTSAVSVSNQAVPSTAGSKLSAVCNSSLKTTFGLTTVNSGMNECSVTHSCISTMKTAVVGTSAVHSQSVSVALKETSGVCSKPVNTSVTCSSMSMSFVKPRMLTFSSVSNRAVNTAHSLPSAVRLSAVSRTLHPVRRTLLHPVRPVRSIAVRPSSVGGYSSALEPTKCRPWRMASVPVSLRGSTVPLASTCALQRSSYRPAARLIRPVSSSALAPSARAMPLFQRIRYASSVSYCPDARLIRPVSSTALAPSARVMPLFQRVRCASSVSHICYFLMLHR